ncbi:MAG: flagellar basal body P-ring formation chaperone FlgA [bacterium]
MTNEKKFCIVIILFSLAIVTGVSQASTIEILVPSQITTNEPYIFLKDVAFIVGPEEDVAKIGQINIGKSPNPGFHRNISKTLINLNIKKEGYEEKDYILNMGNFVKIEVSQKKIEAEELITVVRDYIQEKIASEKNEINVELNRNIPAIITPDVDYKLRVSYNNSSALRGNISIPIDVIIDNKVWRKIFLGVKISIVEEVYVANRNIQRGKSINKEDFTLETRNLDQLSNGEPITVFTDKLLENSVLNINIKAGDVLTEKHLKQPFILAWGDEVTAKMTSGNIEFSTMVRAEQRGRIGDIIKVKNIQSNKNLKAKIISNNLVEIIK